MNEADFYEFLLRWQKWYFHDHTIRGLGIAQSAYAERVGSSYSTTDPAHDIEIEISLWNDFFSKELPVEVKQAIWVEYLVAGKKSEKHKDVGISARDYGPRLKFAVSMARGMFNRAMDARRVSA